MHRSKVAIVGAGASGCLLAVQLLRRARHRIDVVLIEPHERIGRGLAYDTSDPAHLLNVRADRMSALPDDPSHFSRWLESSGATQVAQRFVPRHLYGMYVASTVEEAQHGAHVGVTLTAVRDSVADIVPCSSGAVVRLQESGRAIFVRRVALAIGNLVGPGPLACLSSDPHYLANPWATRALARIEPDDTVLLLGTGLTMVDVVLTLFAQGHRARVVALSRHGLLPRSHASVAEQALDPPPLLAMPPRVGVWLRAVRAPLARGESWRQRIDSLRALTPLLWRQLDTTERQRFLRHLRPYWDVHRHRMPPAASRRLAALITQKALAIRKGRIAAAESTPEGIRVQIVQRGGLSVETCHSKWLVNATGPEQDPARAFSPLVQQLLRSGGAAVDKLRVGLSVADDGRVLDALGRVSETTYALGPLTRSSQWESTAIPEIREQAKAIAAQWLADLAGGWSQ